MIPVSELGGGSKVSRSHLPADDKLVRLEMLHKVAKELVASLDLQQLMQSIFQEIIKSLNAEAGSLWTVDKDRGEMVCQVADGPDGGGKIVGLRIPIGTGVVGWVGQKGKSTIVYDTTKDSRFSKAADRKTGFQTKTMICAPLKFKGEVLGAVQVINRKNSDTQFTDDDLGLLDDIAGYAAISINNARLYESQRRVKDLQAILQLSEEMTAHLDRDKILVTAVNASKDLIDFDRAVIALEANGKAKLAAISGQATIDTAHPENKRLAEVLEFLLSRNQEVWIPDADDYLAKSDALPQLVSHFRNRPETKAFWARVLKDEEGVLGIMAMESGRKNFIAKQQFEVLTILTAQTSIALRNAQLYQKVPFVGVWERIKAQGGESRTTQMVSVGIILALVVMVFLIPNPWSTVKGDLEVTPAVRRPLYASVEGTVERVYFKESDTVAAGEEIVRFDTRDLEREIAGKKAELEKIELQLAAEVSNPDRLTESRYRQVRDELQLRQEQLRRARITSPIDGIVMTPRMEDLEGKLLRESDEVVVVAGLERLEIEVAVSEKDIKFIRPVPPGIDLKDPEAVKGLQKATLKVESFKDEAFTGYITRVDQKLTDKNGTRVVIVRIEIDNPKEGGEYKLKPGMTGRAEIEIEPMTLAGRFMHALGW